MNKLLFLTLCAVLAAAVDILAPTQGVEKIAGS